MNERETLSRIIEECDRHPLLVGFAHHEPTRQELQERIDTIRAIAKQAVEAAPAIAAMPDARDAPVEEAVRQEREACARIVEQFAPATQDMLSTQIADNCEMLALAIRSRTTP